MAGMHEARPATVTDGLHDALDVLAGVDLAQLRDREVLEAARSLQEAEARLAAAKARVVAELHQRGAHRLDGAQTASQWIAHTCRIPRGIAARDVTVARSLRCLPELAHALADGDTGIDKVRAVVRLHRCPRTRALIERDDDLLATAARNLDWVEFQQALAYWVLHNDPDGSDNHADARRQRRRFAMAQLLDGSWHLDGLLDPVAGTIVDTALRRVTDQLYDSDRHRATEQLGRDPLPTELARTPQQRRADALVELAHRASSTPPGARRPAPLVNVVVDIATFGTIVSELFDGTVLDPSDIAPLLDDAMLESIVLDGPERVMRVGRQRCFRGALRRAIELRDRRCAHPLCDAPAWRCDVDHTTPYGAGGITSQDNGRLYCPFHNHLRQQRPPPDDDDDVGDGRSRSP